MRRLVPCPSCQRHIHAAPDEGEANLGCPHCGTREINGVALWVVVAASLTLAACSTPAVAVYGPPPEPNDVRIDASAAPSASQAPPNFPPVDVYGPPPRDPDQRGPNVDVDAGALPSPITPTPPTSVKVPPPVAPVYGPPPRRPDQRDPLPPSGKQN